MKASRLHSTVGITFDFLEFCIRSELLSRMTSPQGVDDLFWGRDCEDITDWTERLTMAAEVRDLTRDKLFKIAKLNLRGRAKEWVWRL